MSSRVVTYARKNSAAEAAQTSKNAAGTAEADTVFLAPDEPPPVSAGDIDADGKPLSVIESHVHSAPCVKTETPPTEVLLVRNENEMFVRQIDSVIYVGVTKPKSTGADKKKGAKKADGGVALPVMDKQIQKISGEKGQIEKIKFSRQQINKQKEHTSLKR